MAKFIYCEPIWQNLFLVAMNIKIIFSNMKHARILAQTANNVMHCEWQNLFLVGNK